MSATALAPPDRGQVSLVVVAERPGWTPAQPVAHDPCGVAALLHRHRREPRQHGGGPSRPRTRTMSPIASTSGWPGSVRSSSTSTRPARSDPDAPPACRNARASPEATTPAAHTTVRDSIAPRRRRRHGSSPTRRPRRSPGESSRDVTPRRVSDRWPRAERRVGNAVSSRSAASTSRIRAWTARSAAELAARPVAGDLGDLAGHLNAGGTRHRRRRRSATPPCARGRARPPQPRTPSGRVRAIASASSIVLRSGACCAASRRARSSCSASRRQRSACRTAPVAGPRRPRRTRARRDGARGRCR